VDGRADVLSHRLTRRCVQRPWPSLLRYDVAVTPLRSAPELRPGGMKTAAPRMGGGAEEFVSPVSACRSVRLPTGVAFSSRLGSLPLEERHLCRAVLVGGAVAHLSLRVRSLITGCHADRLPTIPWGRSRVGPPVPRLLRARWDRTS
jgi:hypothetical protein